MALFLLPLLLLLLFVLFCLFVNISARIRLEPASNKGWDFGKSQIVGPMVVVVWWWCGVVAFSSRVRILGECSTIDSPPALFF